MTRLLWDQVGERLYEAGLDRGVLYLAGGGAVPWNGMTSIDEDMSNDSSEPAYFDGVKYLDVPTTGDYEASLNAFTYPDEFLDYEGITDLGNGVFVDGQDAKLFGLSYRTKIGNDLSGTDHAYKLHLVYNLTAIPQPHTFETLSDGSQISTFSWKVSGVPLHVAGYKPTAHVIFDSRYLDPAMFAGLEALLYGDDDDDPQLPTIDELIDFVSFWAPKLIVPDEVTGLSELVPGSGDLTQINIPGVFSALPTSRLVESSTEGFYQLVP